MSNEGQTASELTSNTKDFVLAEYNNLRAEIGIRLGLEFQIISLNLIALGAAITLGIKKENTAFLLFYPVLIMFFSAIWRDNQLRIKEIATHIKNEIAPRAGRENISWERSQETYYSGKSGRLHGILSLFGKRGTFIGNALLVLLIALSLHNFQITNLSQTEITALIVGAISFVITCFLLLSPVLENIQLIGTSIQPLIARLRNNIGSSQPINPETPQPTHPIEQNQEQ